MFILFCRGRSRRREKKRDKRKTRPWAAAAYKGEGILLGHRRPRRSVAGTALETFGAFESSSHAPEVRSLCSGAPRRLFVCECACCVSEGAGYLGFRRWQGILTYILTFISCILMPPPPFPVCCFSCSCGLVAVALDVPSRRCCGSKTPRYLFLSPWLFSVVLFNCGGGDRHVPAPRLLLCFPSPLRLWRAVFFCSGIYNFHVFSLLFCLLYLRINRVFFP